MSFLRLRPIAGAAILALAGTGISELALAEKAADQIVRLDVSGPSAADVEDAVRAASSLLGTVRDGNTEPDDLYGAARAEYASIVNALYAVGHYGPVVHVLIDGREAASIPPLEAPKRIGLVTVTVDPGPKFQFSDAVVAPLAPETRLPEDFARGKVARSDLVRQAVQTGVDGWRDVGHAKTKVASQRVIANHNDSTLSANVQLNPGPRLRFGTLTVKGNERMRTGRIHKIAGLPEGEVYSPEDLRRSVERLRRSGVFSSVTLTEAEAVRAPDYLDITATVVEERRRRYSIGAEISSLDGIDLTGSWLHRNLMGGGERLRVDAEIGNIGAQSSGVDYGVAVQLDRPATLTPDTTLSFKTAFAHLDDEDYIADIVTLGAGFSHFFSEELTASFGLEFGYAEVDDFFDEYTYEYLNLPIGITWDTRDTKLDAQKGFFLSAQVSPFQGFNDTDSGVRITADGRAYLTFGEERPVTLAGRAQLGTIIGSSLLGTPRDFLFYSGGGGTVRGQPYQSLGVDYSEIYAEKIGGMAFGALSGEVRARVTQKIGVVGFLDLGYVGAMDFGGDYDNWHGGAGLGVRYATGFGPIRFDVAAPIEGSIDTGDGVQFYIGIGQAF